MNQGPELIRRAAAVDAAVISDLASSTFYQTYVSLHPENAALLRAYTHENFTPEKVLLQLQSPGVEYYLIESGHQYLGYMKTIQGQGPEQVKLKPSLCLEKFYIAQGFKGRGLGQMLFDYLLHLSKSSGHESIWLSVYENNPGAIAFYLKNGFKIVGETDFLYLWNGSEYRDRDKLMERRL